MLVLDELLEHINEEEHDANSYAELADKLEEEYPGYACIVRDIAKEELTHKMYLESIVKGM